MKCCRDCIRCRENVNGTHTCTMTKEKLIEEELSSKSCNKYLGASSDESQVMYKDYDDMKKIRFTHDCNTCKYSTTNYDPRQERDRFYCSRRKCYIVDSKVAASTCGFFRANKKELIS